MKPFTRTLHNIVQDHYYSEHVIDRALGLADSEEVRVCLIALKSGRRSFESRMVLQDFIVRLDSLDLPADDMADIEYLHADDMADMICSACNNSALNDIQGMTISDLATLVPLLSTEQVRQTVIGLGFSVDQKNRVIS